LIIPFAHESHAGRRWPLVTIGLIVVNLVCLIAFTLANAGAVERISALATDVIEFRDSHPLVTDSCRPLAHVPHRHVRSEPLAIQASSSREADQAQYDGFCAALQQAIDDSPAQTFGYVPGRNNLLGLITYQFVHAGWLHLVSNMWFLWLCGANIEDRWGRAVYLPFYLSAGIAAAFTQKLFSMDSMVPIVGASGAIAGAMGAFLVLFARTRVRFAYAFFFVRWGTFTAPAIVMLPLWLGTEIFWGLLQTSGVAHWAHVGGFVYGAIIALVLKRTGIETSLDSAVEQKVTTAQDPRILRAGDLIDAGSTHQAMTLLMTVAQEHPKSIDAQLELLRAAKKASYHERERGAYARLVELYFETGAASTAADLFAEMVSLDLHTEMPRGWLIEIAEKLGAGGFLERAEVAYAAACSDGVVDQIAVRATLAHGRVLLELRRKARAREVLTGARGSPFSSPELGLAIDEALAKAELP
jgi:membrane associated rhomboid family serine protease